VANCRRLFGWVIIFEKYCFVILNSCEKFSQKFLGNRVVAANCDNLPYSQSDAAMLQNHSSLSSGVLQVVVFSPGGLLLGSQTNYLENDRLFLVKIIRILCICYRNIFLEYSQFSV